MVNTDAALPYAHVLVASDLSDASAEAARSARFLGLLEHARLTVTHAFDAATKSKLALADAAKDRIKAYVEEERRRSTLELEIFMKSLSFDAGTWSHYVAEGDAVPVIAEAVEMVRPDLLVVGTHGRSGMAKVLLGSVAEQLLRALEIDILPVPRAAITA